MEKRDRFIGVNSIRFYERFPNADACYRYIADIKWVSGFVFVRNAVMNIIVQASNHHQDVVHDVSMMKAQHLTPCLISVSFHFILPFIFLSR